jgi:hypothetical protein
MSIETDISTLQTKCSEAERIGDQFHIPAQMIRVEVPAQMLRRLIEQALRLMAPKHLPRAQEWPDTDGQGL